MLLERLLVCGFRAVAVAARQAEKIAEVVEAEAARLQAEVAQLKADVEAARAAAADAGERGNRPTAVELGAHGGDQEAGNTPSAGSSQSPAADGSPGLPGPPDRGKVAMDDLISSVAELRAELQQTLLSLQATAGVPGTT